MFSSKQKISAASQTHEQAAVLLELARSLNELTSGITDDAVRSKVEQQITRRILESSRSLSAISQELAMRKI